MQHIDKVYICHYTPLTDRKSHMIEQAKQYSIDHKLHFVTEFDRENLTPSELKKFDTSKLKLCEISLFMKHIACMRYISLSNKTFGVIMEDDVIFKDNFITNFDAMMNIIPDQFDILYTGFFPFIADYQKSSNKSSPIPDNVPTVGCFKNMTDIVVFPWTGNNKGTDFYVISRQCCNIFLDIFDNLHENQQISHPIDHYMGLLLYSKNANVYWSDHEITIHGSWGEGWNKNAKFANSMTETRGH